MEKKSKLDLILGIGLIAITAQALNLFTVFRLKNLLDTQQIALPRIPLAVILVFFLSTVIFMGIILFLVPNSILKIIMRVIFAFAYLWGMMIALSVSFPVSIAIPVSLVICFLWLIKPRVFLQNLLLIFALVSAGALFGPLFAPWKILLFLLAISIYDIVAVRSGYMIWMAKQLSDFHTLPAFIIPQRVDMWNLSLKEADLNKLMDGKAVEKELSLLGGGDIGLPLILVASVFFTYGFVSSLIVAAFSLGGLVFAYWLHLYLFKGKPLPALPPISVVALIGYLVVRLMG
ncbi:MAG: presenilin family intramembrane aspartyl protease [Chloroflexota bacterium]